MGICAGNHEAVSKGFLYGSLSGQKVGFSILNHLILGSEAASVYIPDKGIGQPDGLSFAERCYTCYHKMQGKNRPKN